RGPLAEHEWGGCRGILPTQPEGRRQRRCGVARCHTTVPGVREPAPGAPTCKEPRAPRPESDAALKRTHSDRPPERGHKDPDPSASIEGGPPVGPGTR